jgi:hypothetical protein
MVHTYRRRSPSSIGWYGNEHATLFRTTLERWDLGRLGDGGDDIMMMHHSISIPVRLKQRQVVLVDDGDDEA